MPIWTVYVMHTQTLVYSNAVQTLKEYEYWISTTERDPNETKQRLNSNLNALIIIYTFSKRSNWNIQEIIDTKFARLSIDNTRYTLCGIINLHSFMRRLQSISMHEISSKVCVFFIHSSIQFHSHAPFFYHVSD